MDGQAIGQGRATLALMFPELLAMALAIYLVYLVARKVMGKGLGGGSRRSSFQCETCRSCGRLFDDGVLCQFQGRETFKNETHIANCVDHEPR